MMDEHTCRAFARRKGPSTLAIIEHCRLGLTNRTVTRLNVSSTTTHSCPNSAGAIARMVFGPLVVVLQSNLVELLLY